MAECEFVFIHCIYSTNAELFGRKLALFTMIIIYKDESRCHLQQICVENDLEMSLRD